MKDQNNTVNVLQQEFEEEDTLMKSLQLKVCLLSNKRLLTKFTQKGILTIVLYFFIFLFLSSPSLLHTMYICPGSSPTQELKSYGYLMYMCVIAASPLFSFILLY